MTDKLPSLSAVAMVKEFIEADLGDERLNGRLLRLAPLIASSPSTSFAGMCQANDEREAIYRFVRNDRVDPDDVMEPHVQETVERAKAAREVLVIHDTSTFRVAENADLESYINTGKRGFFAHVSLAVDAKVGGMPLGVLHLERILRAKPKRRGQARRLSGSQTIKQKDREFTRWFRAVEATDTQLAGHDAIHVMDREGDSYELMGQMSSRGRRFVLRMSRNRRSTLADDPSTSLSVRDALESAQQTKLTREVHVNARRQKSAPTAAKRTPQRDRRTARLRISFTSVELRKPGYLRVADGHPCTLPVNVVHVYEPAPPEGAEPIDWVLFTNLPVNSAEDAERIVDIYCRRWLIEEFFRALKTGCAYRKRRLTNRQSIFNTLAMLVPVAWKVLALRHAARAVEQAKAAAHLSALEFDALRAKARQLRCRMGRHPSVQDALRVIARIGGHRPSAGPPGWEVLMRGMERFMGLVEGYALAKAEM